jgi:hypothetical protein
MVVGSIMNCVVRLVTEGGLPSTVASASSATSSEVTSSLRFLVCASPPLPPRTRISCDARPRLSYLPGVTSITIGISTRIGEFQAILVSDCGDDDAELVLPFAAAAPTVDEHRGPMPTTPLHAVKPTQRQSKQAAE